MVSKKEDDKESIEPEIYENENEGQLEENHIPKVKKKRNSDGGSWYPEACASLWILHRLHTPFEKSLIERAIYSILRIELNVLMITILVLTTKRRKRIVIYCMYTIG